MANVVLVSFLLAVALQVGAGSAWPWAWSWASEACTEPGALREGLWGGASVCVAGEGWRHVPTNAGLDDLHSAAPRANPDCTGLVGKKVCDTTCSLLGVCLTSGNWVSVETCTDPDKFCSNGECTNVDPGTCTTPETIKCGNDGIYPNLQDCSQKYICDQGALGVMDCEDNTIFNACTGTCDIELSAGEECSWANSSSPCTEPGASGVAPNNDRIYYVCAEGTSGLELIWLKCAKGHFNVASGKCENESVLGCGLESGGNSGGSTTTTTTTTTTTSSPISCTPLGASENPSTNCNYYYCFQNGTQIIKDCHNGYHFDRNYGACIYGPCT